MRKPVFRLAMVIVACLLSGEAQTCQDIRKVDFRNMTIHTAAPDENELTTLFNASHGQFSFQFKNGVAEEFTSSAQQKDGTPEARAKLFADSIVSVPDGPTIRFLQISWEHLQGSGSFAILAGFVCQNNRLKGIFQFSAEGADFGVGPGDQLVIQQAIWRGKDGHCCPSQMRTIYYGWDVDHQKFRRLRVDGPNPLPERR